MCTVLFAWKWAVDVPWLVAANRDELRARPSDPPGLLQADPPLWGGRDRMAGGTWLAVDPTGRVCAVTNRHPGGRLPARDPNRRSRGELPLDVLRGGDDASAAHVLAELDAASYNPVNVLYLSAGAAEWVGLDDEAGVRRRDLEPGIHVLTEQDPDDPASEKTARLLAEARAAGETARDGDDLLRLFRAILAGHDRGPSDLPQGATCIHQTEYGTVSSAVVAATADGVRFAHAEGQPCVTPYLRVLGPSR
jgi:uncharacterized protein with NRDE domain